MLLSAPEHLQRFYSGVSSDTYWPLADMVVLEQNVPIVE